jgi:hypothetical protein
VSIESLKGIKRLRGLSVVLENIIKMDIKYRNISEDKAYKRQMILSNGSLFKHGKEPSRIKKGREHS